MNVNELQPGDLAPWFRARTSDNPRYSFDSVAGRYVVMLFFGSASTGQARSALRSVAANAGLFDDMRACFFGVSVDPSDETEGRVQNHIPGRRFFFDFDREVSYAYGAAVPGTSTYTAFWLVLDPQLRVMARFKLGESDVAMTFVKRLPPVEEHAGCVPPAPVLVIPRVFEPAFCQHLIGLYERHGGEDSGFMRDVDGKTTKLIDYAHKRRMDYDIDDGRVQGAARLRIKRRLVPMIKQAFQFEVTRMERYIVACYDAADSAHFRPHRDNTTLGTAHRRFACTINLNAGEYEGGDLRFPEFGPRTYRAPTGGAVVFSCSLLHEAAPVTRGKRYAFLPFLYDDAAARVRLDNNRYLDESVGAYRLETPP